MDEDWDWENLSDTVPLSFIDRFPYKSWAWGNYSVIKGDYLERGVWSHPDLTIEFIEKYMDRWDWEVNRYCNGIYTADCLTQEFTDKHMDKIDLSVYRYLYDQGLISWTFVLKKWDSGQWNWTRLSRDVDSAFALEHYRLPWNWVTILERMGEWSETFERLISEVTHHVDFRKLSTLPTLPLRVVQMYIDQPWNWEKLYERFPGTFEMINYKEVSRENPFVRLRMLETNPDKDWQWLKLSQNVPLDFIDRNPHFPWDWGWITTRRTERSTRDRAAAWTHSGFLYDNLSLKVVEMM